MLVEDLIEKLKELPQDLPVVVWNEYHFDGWTPVKRIVVDSNSTLGTFVYLDEYSGEDK